MGDDEDPYGRLELADLGDPSPATPSAGVEHSFADAELEDLGGSPPRSKGGTGGHADPPGDPGDPGDPGMTDLSPGAGEGGGIELAVEGARKGQRLGETVGVDRYADARGDGLQQRGATGVGAVLPSGPAPVGHKSRAFGLFFPETVDNVLAAMAIGMLVGILPARLVSASHLDSVGVDAALESMQQGHEAIANLLDETRVDEGPQSIPAVEAALKDEVKALDQTAAEVDEAVASSKSRYWIVWAGVGLPLGLALSFLRRKG